MDTSCEKKKEKEEAQKMSIPSDLHLFKWEKASYRHKYSFCSTITALAAKIAQAHLEHVLYLRF